MDLNENEVEDINLMVATMDTLESNKVCLIVFAFCENYLHIFFFLFSVLI